MFSVSLFIDFQSVAVGRAALLLQRGALLAFSSLSCKHNFHSVSVSAPGKRCPLHTGAQRLFLVPVLCRLLAAFKNKLVGMCLELNGRGSLSVSSAEVWKQVPCLFLCQQWATCRFCTVITSQASGLQILCDWPSVQWQD